MGGRGKAWRPCLGSLSAGHRVPIRCPCPRAGPGLPALGNQGSNLLLSLVCGPPRPPDRTKAGLGATEPGVGPGRQVPECGGISLCCQGTGVGCPSSWLVGSHRPKLENTAQRECSGSSCPAKAGGPRPAGVGEHWACSTELPEGGAVPRSRGKGSSGLRHQAEKPGHPSVPAGPLKSCHPRGPAVQGTREEEAQETQSETPSQTHL